MDRSPIYERVQNAFDNAIEITSTEDALKRWPEELIEKYWWRAVMPDKDKYTALVALHQTEGYFIRVKAGHKVDKPIQACLFVSESNVSQNVHNIIIVEDGAEANVITGCNIHTDVKEGLHAGISEFYVGKGASLTFTMVHNWAEDFSVRPRTGIVRRGGRHLHQQLRAAQTGQVDPGVPRGQARGRSLACRVQLDRLRAQGLVHRPGQRDATHRRGNAQRGRRAHRAAWIAAPSTHADG